MVRESFARHHPVSSVDHLAQAHMTQGFPGLSKRNIKLLWLQPKHKWHSCFLPLNCGITNCFTGMVLYHCRLMLTTRYRLPAFKGAAFPKSSCLHMSDKDFGSCNVFNLSDFEISKPTALLLFWSHLNKKMFVKDNAI